MDKKLIEELKENLKKEESLIEKMLGGFAKKDEKTPGDWDTRFPSMGEGTSGVDLEKEADEVEQYGTMISIEHSLETRLKNIILALKKIEEGGYGICEKCKKPININRLKVSPESKFCLKCK
ncbi:MAG: TraR/DksA C4-type zinc finger protein [Patescibacteria group bacterium]|nr:TraR/DksA C4-type zinc finger protein [Patescibacteria group bacterium]MBU1876921.1 TraR/DksA C4-type zinc finger protein [Patescibacteria group bacterium]